MNLLRAFFICGNYLKSGVGVAGKIIEECRKMGLPDPEFLQRTGLFVYGYGLNTF